METELSLDEIKSEWHGSYKSYIIGFLFSLLLTTLSFWLVATKTLSNQHLVYVIVALALTQATIQLLFFLHLGQEAKPRWESFTFWFMILVVLIVVGGSMWIMYDLDDRVMFPMNMELHHD